MNPSLLLFAMRAGFIVCLLPRNKGTGTSKGLETNVLISKSNSNKDPSVDEGVPT